MSTRFAVRPGSIRLNMQQKLDAEEWNQVLEKQHELDLVVDTNVGTDQILQVADKVNAINTLIINNHLNDTILRSVENLIQTPCTANMKVFQLSNNNLTKENSIRVLQAVAKECMALETLSIDHNNIDIPSLNAILEAVPLKVLCLRWTSLDANDVSLLSSQLAKTKSLKKFILEETELGEIGAKNLFKALSIANSVEYLSLRKSSITQQATKSILKYLLKFSALKILCIPNNGIGGPGLGEIAPWLEHKNLVELDLAGNDIGCYGARIVANMLTDNGTLERLSLRMNNIQDTGAGLIATALLSNSTIEYLSLSQNRITDEGGMAIARAAGNNTSLQSLDLVGNEITDKCAEFFIELGKSTRSIHSLGIGFNLLSDIYSEKINTIFEIKSILHSLDLSLRQIPQVFQEFNQVSLNYLRELKISGESAYRYKILVVGAECVGKTSLVKNIMGTQWSAFEEKCYAKPGFLKKRYSVTDGIDVHRWIPSNSQVVLNVWDFGGHELYQTTHQFFLTPRTIYAVVFDGRVDLFCNKIVEWLNCIQSRSPGEVVVLVGTHFDKKAAKAKANEINEQLEQLLADISRITSSENQFQILRTPEGKIFWQTCTKTGREFGVQELVQTLIEEGKQRAAEVKVPHSWLELRKRITSLRNGLIVPVIDYNVMVGLAAEHKIFGPHVDLACKLLQDWSEILIVPQRLHQSSDAHSELIIIDPRWMIDVFESLLSLKDIPTKEHTIRPSISKLITKALKSSKDIKELYLEKKGKLESDATTDTVSEYLISREELENNWREKQIPENFFGALMDLLQFHFELIAEVEPKQYLAPCLMRNETEPSVVSKFWSLEKLQVKEVFRQYDFPFLPYGFFSRLCVEIIQRDRTTWNNIWHVTHIWGTGLEIARTDSQLSSTDRAKIEIYHPNNSGTNCSLYIRTRGCGKKAGGGMIVLVHHIVMQLLQDYSGLSSRIRIYVGIRSPNAKESIVLSRQDCIGNILLHKSVNPELAWLIPELFPSTVSKDGGMDGTERNLIASKEQYKHEVVLRRELGSGISGAVYEGTWLGQHVAIKIPHIDHSSIYRIDDFFQEVELLRSLDHPNILKFFYRYHSPPVVIVEFCGGGDLLCVLTANTHISDVLVIRISLDIAEALSYLHNHQPPILHGDVRPPNVLIKQLSPYAEVTAVLADVGNAQIADPITLTWNDKTTATDMSGFIAILEQLLVCMEAQSESDSESSTQSNEFGTTEKLYALKDQCKENLEFPFATVAKTLRELFTIHENHYLEKRGRDKQRPKPKGGKGRYKEIKTQLCAAIERQDFELICGVLRVAHSRIPFDSNNYRWVKFSHIIFEYLTSLTLNGESAKLQEIFEIGFVDVSEPLAGNYLLHYAAESGHLNCLKTISKMLGTNPDICTKTVSGNTPLHLAVSQGHTNCAQYLIKTNASVNALDNKHQTPILKATRSAFYDCIQLLLTNNANPNIQNMLGESPLSIAAGFVHSFDPKNDPNFRCVILLLCNNADIPLSIDKHSKNVIRSAAKILLSSYWTSVLINPKIQNHLHNVLEASSPTTTETPVTNDTQSEFSDFDAYSLAEEDI